MRSVQRKPFKISVSAPSSGLNTRLPKIGSGALANYGAYSSSAAGMDSVVALRDATFATNMRFEDGVACNSPGYELVTMTPAPDGPINLIGQANTSSQLANIATRSPIIGTTESLYAQNTASGYLLVFAGPPQVIFDATTATLTSTFLDTFGAGTNTPTFLWSQVSGPGGATITNPAQETTGITGLVPGTYVFQVEASDSGMTATANVTISVYVGGTTVQTIPGFTNAGSACACPVNGYIYVGNDGYGMIQAYDPGSNSIVATVTGFNFDLTFGNSEVGPIVFNPIDLFLYVLIVGEALDGSGNSLGWVVKVDPTSNTIVSQIQLPANMQNNSAFCLLPSNALVMTAYNVGVEMGFITVNLTTFTMGVFTGLGDGDNFDPLQGICFNASNGLCYSTRCNAAGNVGIYTFNPVSLAVTSTDTGTIAVNGSINSIAYCPVDNNLYIANFGDGTAGNLYQWNLTGAPTLTSIFVGLPCFQVMWEPNNAKIYFVIYQESFGLSQICFYNPTLKVNFTGVVTFPYDPLFLPNNIAFSPLYNSLYLPTANVYALNAP